MVIEDTLDCVELEQNENDIELVVENMLNLAQVELIFITVAHMGPCFGFVLEMVLITQGCFHFC